MSDARPLRRFFQFRITSLLGLITGIAIGFAPLKLWEVWRRPSPGILVRMEFVEVDREALAQLREEETESAGQTAGSSTLRESLDILAQRGKARTVSAPQLMTLDGQAATVQVGGLVAPPTAGPMQFRGIYYQITPKLQRSGNIKLDYTINLQSPGSAPSLLASAQLEVGQNEPVIVAADARFAIDNTDRELLVILSAESPDARSPLTAVARPSSLPPATAAAK